MWICLNKAFYSIVQDKMNPARLLVRARRKNDIPKCFPNAQVIADAGTDYKYRAFIPREQVAEAITKEILGISYSNFKRTTELDSELHSAYLNIWRIMFKLQEAEERRLS